MLKLNSIIIVRVQEINTYKYKQYMITLPQKIVKRHNLQKGSELAVLDGENYVMLIPVEKLREMISIV